MANYFKKGLRGSVILLILAIGANLFGYFSRAFLARILSPEQFGLFYAALTFFDFLLIFINLGYGSALVKFIPKFKVENKKEKVESAFAHVFHFRLVLSLVFASITLFLADFLVSNYFKAPFSKIVVYIFCALLIIRNFNTYIGHAFQALQDMLRTGLVTFLNKFLFFILAVVLFYAGFAKNALLPSIAFISAITLTVLFLITPLYRKIRPSKIWHKFDKRLFHNLSGFALPTVLSHVSEMVIGYIDTLLLVYFLTLEKVGIYNVVLPTVLLIGHISGAMCTVLFPIVSEIWAKKDTARLKSAVSSLYTYAAFITLPFILAIIVYPKSILKIFFGPSYVSGFWAMRILAIGVIFIALAKINFSILLGIGKPKEITRITFFTAGFNALFNILLIPTFGIEGAAVTTTLSYLIMLLWSYRRTMRFVKFKPPLKVFGKLFIISAIFILSLFLFKNHLHFNMYVNAFIGGVVSFIIYVGLALKLKIITPSFLKRILSSLGIR